MPRASRSRIFSLDLFKIHTFSVGLLGNLFARIGSGAMPYLIPLLLQVSLGYQRVRSRPDDAAGRGGGHDVQAARHAG